MAEGTPENQVTYFTVQGHSHDGVNSSKVDFSGYDLYDFISESDLRRIILDAVNDGTLEPQGGIRISPPGGGGGRLFGPAVPGAASGLSHTCSINEDGASIRNVAWLKSDNATSYIIELHRSIDNGSNYLKVQEVTTKLLGHSFEQTPMANTTLTKYKLVLYPQSDAGIIGTYQELSNISPCVDTTAPAGPKFEDAISPAPPNFFVSFRGFLARLQEQTEADTKWGIGQFEYSVSESIASEGQWAANEADNGRQTGRVLSVTGLATGTPYYLRVRAYDNSNNYSPWTYWNGVGDDGDATMSNADSFTPTEITGTEIGVNSITTGHIQANTIVAGDIAAHTITAGEIGANAITADRIESNFILVDHTIESDAYVAGVAGWMIQYDGTAEFNSNVTMRGATISDSSLTVNSGSPSEVKFRVTTAGNTTINGTLTVGDYASGNGMNWNGSTLTVKGIIESNIGIIGGWVIDSGKIRSDYNANPADGGSAISDDDIVLGITNQAVSIGDGRAVMRRYRFGAGDGDLKIGIDADAGMDPIYGTAGDMLMWWDDGSNLAKFSLGDKLLFDGSTLTLGDGITLTSGTPSSTNNTLYADGTTLKWHGAAIGGSSNTYGTALTETSGTVNHDDYITGGTSGGVGYYIRSLTVNAQGHITAIDTEPESTIAETFYWVVAAGGTAGTTQIGPSTETLTFNGGGATSVTRGTNTIEITSTDTVYTHPTSAGNKHIPSGGSADQFLKYSSSGTAVWAAAPADATKLPLTGGTLSGGISFSNGNHITGSASSHVYFQGGGGTGSTAWLRENSSGSAKISCGSGLINVYATLTPYTSLGHDLGGGSNWWDYSYHKKMDTSALPGAAGSGWYMWFNTSDEVMKASSSERIKKDIVTIPTTEALDRIKALRPVEFTPKTNTDALAIDDLWEFKRYRGFIAEEAAAVDKDYGLYNWWKSNDPESEDYDKTLPSLSSLQKEWTDEEVDDYYDLDEARPQMFDLHAILADSVGAIQELSNKLDAAEARLAALEA